MAKIKSPSGKVIKPDDRLRYRLLGEKIIKIDTKLKRIYAIRNQ